MTLRKDGVCQAPFISMIAGHNLKTLYMRRGLPHIAIKHVPTRYYVTFILRE
jgi:hypothetical protein